MKILMIANSSFKLVNFRNGLIRRLRSDGHDLIALAPRDDLTPELEALGVTFMELPMQPTGTSPLAEGQTLLHIVRQVMSIQPDAILSYTIKANLYGGLAARLSKARFIPNVTGLGSVFDKQGLRRQAFSILYRIAFGRSNPVFFQNDSDQSVFLDRCLVRSDQARLLPGSGVDLEKFPVAPLPGEGQRITFLLVARMLVDKGITLFAEAAGRLKTEFPEARFRLLGPLFEGKETSLTLSDLEGLQDRFGVEYLGYTQSVRDHLLHADCVVLPSYYREGTPRALLEAGAMGRPIITTRMPGCRDVVDDGVNGFLCEPRDLESLVEAMRRFARLQPTQRQEMGRKSSQKIQKDFNESIVIDAYLHGLGLA